MQESIVPILAFIFLVLAADDVEANAVAILFLLILSCLLGLVPPYLVPRIGREMAYESTPSLSRAHDLCNRKRQALSEKEEQTASVSSEILASEKSIADSFAGGSAKSRVSSTEN